MKTFLIDLHFPKNKKSKVEFETVTETIDGQEVEIKVAKQNIDYDIKRYFLPQTSKQVKKINESIDILEMLNTKEFESADTDVYLQYLIDIFGGQFTLADVDKAVFPEGFVKTVYSTALYVTGRVSEAFMLFNDEFEQSEDDTKN